MNSLIYPTLFIVCISVYLAILLLLLIGLFRLRPGQNRIQYPVSVILVARNEAHQIDRCLAAFVNQDYPEHLLQFILVNDRSHDHTGERMAKFCEAHSNCIKLDIDSTRDTNSPKKHALAQGISRANGRILLFTDADCQPPPNWVSEMVCYFEPDVVLTAGFSPVVDDNPGLWSRIIEIDSLASAIVAAGSIGIGSAVTCAGRNLAYTQQVFQVIRGFESHLHSLSGDDDLLLQQVKKQSPGKIRYAIGSASNVPSRPVTNLRAFIRQRKRHFSAGKYYSLPLQILYFLFHSANLLLFLGFTVSFIYDEAVVVSGIIFLSKILADFSVFYVGVRKLYHPKILIYFIPWEVYFVLYNTFIGALGLFSKIRWK